ncbi:MAG TPA: hypothetical protein VGW39_14245 [Chthoniobacterales bacterium]|nr:hypothetical protein [Chthoniobacterales bacterium]
MKSPTPNAQAVAIASIGVVTGGNDEVADPISVHFNPVSLQLAVSNELKDSGNQQRKQFIAKTTTKLTMDLIFDTTDTGEDVTKTTRKIQAFLAPQSPPGQPPPKEIPPPLVLFDWGTLRFKGIAENYKETIDFFSANGVPLRSSINLSLSRQDAVFDEPSADAPADAGGVDADLFDAPADSAAGAANNGGAPGAARAVAAANGEESLRFSAGASLTLGASIELKPPVAFASGKLGLSIGGGAGAGIGIGGGLGIGVGGGVGIGLGAGAGLSIGGSASAGISGMARLSASEGAFSGLRITTGSSGSARLNPAKLVPKIHSTTLATDSGATFKVGGKATLEGSAGLRADVGAAGRLTFDAH